jgi:hypothetical protein
MTTKHKKVWPTYLESGPCPELDAMIAPRCFDHWREPGFHLDPGNVIPVRLADGVDAFAVVSKWLPGEGAMLAGIYLDEATADRAGTKEAHRESDHYEHWRCYGGRLSRDVPVTPLWQWNAEIDAWVCPVAGHINFGEEQEPVCDVCGSIEIDMIETSRMLPGFGNRHYCERCWPSYRGLYGEDDACRVRWQRAEQRFAPTFAPIDD